MSVPAGTYALNAKVQATAAEGARYSCALSDVVAGELDDAFEQIPGVANPSFFSTSIPFQAMVKVGAASILTVTCVNVAKGVVNINGGILTAVKVGSLTVG